MGIRRSIITRIAIVYLLLMVFSVVVFYKLFSIQQIKNDRWQTIAKNLKSNTIVVEPNRGNICAEDGSVLATSVPGYRVRMDLAAEGVKKVFHEQSDSLAWYLSSFFRDLPAKEYKRRLNNAYKKGDRDFVLTPRKVDYAELQQMKKFPILRRGRFGGGMLIEQENKRVTPLGILALRTIGGLNKGASDGTQGSAGFTGLEAAYEEVLRGENGVGYKQNLSGRWVTRVEIEPRDGMDIITTLNVKMQDITESALLRQLRATNSDWATAILMEVKTGDIKAVANLGFENGNYYENYNYALGHAGCYEPGSTFKLISLMAALEDGLVDTCDVFDTGSGVWKYKGRTIYDSDYKYGGHGEISVKRIFELSSNVGVAKIITSCYEKNPKAYVDRVFSFGVNKPLGVEVPGEGEPFFKYPGDKDWWGTSLAWMSYGYETKMTPLQILTFYNAVANNGKMMKPRLVREISDKGARVKQFKPVVLNSSIASRETIRKAQKMLEGVCETGTGKSLKNEYFKIAGKTGTAQISTGAGGYQKGMYLASFAGYFPADDPEYSMIVTFNNPRGAYYGGSVAGPVFKEIAEKIYAARITIKEMEELPEPDENILPDIKKGKSKDILKIARELDMEMVKGKPETTLASVKKENNQIILGENEMNSGRVPDVRGMGARNAVYLLENAGLRVKVKGVGKVRQQSLTPGSHYQPGQTVYITLS